MILNGFFWCNYFEQNFVQQICSFANVLEERLLPPLANLDDEAKTIQEQKWKQLLSLPGEDIDGAELADQALEVGITHFELMSGIRQGIINMFAAGIYQLFEQQLMLFHRKQVLHPSEENKASLFKLELFKQRLLSLGIDIDAFGCWGKIEELRFVANTVKHAAGKSATELHALRPDLFELPNLNLSGAGLNSQPSQVYLPIAGEDIFISIEDIACYRDNLISFWHELSNAMGDSEKNHKIFQHAEEK